jgi:hypothetical protein
MERCVYKHIYNHLLQNDILTRNQSGFTKGDSASQTLYWYPKKQPLFPSHYLKLF